MNALTTTPQIPTVPDDWSYEDSISRIQPLVYKWKNLTLEVAQELYIAREKLSKEGRPETGTNVPVKSWNQYCQDIGLEKRTANRWLAQFFPAQHGARQITRGEMCAVSDLQELIRAGKIDETKAGETGKEAVA